MKRGDNKMLLDKEVNVEIAKSNKKYYKNLGYDCKCGDIICVKTEELPKYARTIIHYQCDYCDIIKEQQYQTYRSKLDNNIIHKDACQKCAGIKRKESNLLVYGVSSCMQLPEVQEKFKNTMMEKYGFDNPKKVDFINAKIEATNLERYGTIYPMQNEEVKQRQINVFLEKYGVTSYNKTEEGKEKYKQTCLEKYGVENSFQNEDFQKKQVNTCLERYGVENVFQLEEVKNKSKQTMLNKYGVENALQNDEIKQRAIKNRVITLYENNSVPTSKQQEYLHNLLGGILNYPEDCFNLDIAFPNEKIYIEYDGGGHDLAVKIGRITEKQLKREDMKRYFILKKLGWKQICIKSPNDYLPIDEIIKKEIAEAKLWLSIDEPGHFHYNITISEFVNDSNHGKLRYIS